MTWGATCSRGYCTGRASRFLSGVVTVAISLVIGVTMGILSGYYGGWIDTILMRYIDLQWAFPNFIIAVYLVAVFGTGLSNVIVAVSLAFLDDFARITRGMVLSIREEEYVIAAKSLGASDLHIMLRHVLPNAIAPIIVQATLSVSYAILAEAALSFLGLGVKPTTPTWGLIVSDCAQLLLPRLVAGRLSGAGDHDHGVEHQLSGRCAARHPRRAELSTSPFKRCCSFRQRKSHSGIIWQSVMSFQDCYQHEQA